MLECTIHLVIVSRFSAAGLLLLVLQTYVAACEWVDIVQQMFQETGVPLVALVANKADTEELQAAAAQVPALADATSCRAPCRWVLSHHCLSSLPQHIMQSTETNGLRGQGCQVQLC